MEPDSTSDSLESSQRIRKSHGGLIAVVVVLLLLIGLPAFLIWMAFPGPGQKSRLAASLEGSVGAGSWNILEASGLVIGEQWLEDRGVAMAELMLEDVDEVDFDGLDLVLRENEVRVLVGATATIPRPKHPDRPRRLPMAVEAIVRVESLGNGVMTAEIRRIKIGRLPVPVRFLSRLAALDNRFDGMQSGNLAAFQWNENDGKARFDAAEALAEAFPGMTLKDLHVSAGYISLDMELSQEMDDQLRSLAGEIVTVSSGLEAELIPILDNDQLSMLRRAFESLGNAENGVSPNQPLEGLLGAVTSYGDLWSTLDGEQQDAVASSLTDVFEKHPQLTRNLETFLDSKGWQDGMKDMEDLISVPGDKSDW